MRSLELRIPPVAVALVFAAVMYGVAVLFPAAAFVLPWRVTVAKVLSLLGGFSALAGFLALHRSRTTVSPSSPGACSSLVRVGIYRYSRHPMYLGLLLVLAGLSAYLANAASILVLPTLVLYLNHYQIEPEERALLNTFGTEFSRYGEAVRRWI